MAKKRILIVDDDPDQLLVMQTILEGEGFEVLMAEDAPTGRKLVASEVPDLIITDIMMPGESGYVFLSSLKEDATLRSIPVIVASSMDGEVQTHAAGGGAFLAKPFESAQLVALVTKLLSGKDPSARLARAIEFARQGEYDEAEKNLKSILVETDEGKLRGQAFFQLGEIARNQGKTEDAVAYYKKAILVDADNWRAHKEIGELMFASSEYRRALFYFRQSLASNPEQPDLSDKIDWILKETDAEDE